MKLLVLFVLCAVRLAIGADVRKFASTLSSISLCVAAFSLLVAQEAVVDFGMSVDYKNTDQPEFAPYASCQGNDECVALNWDDDAELRVTVNFPEATALEDFGPVSVGGNILTEPVAFKIHACFETEFTRNRKWRKPKDVIQVRPFRVRQEAQV